MPAVGNPPSNAIVTIADGASLASAGCRFGSSLRGPRGFTLIELLVALSLVAVIAVLSWRGIDAMARAQQSTQQHTDEVLALQAGRVFQVAQIVRPTPNPNFRRVEAAVSEGGVPVLSLSTIVGRN